MRLTFRLAACAWVVAFTAVPSSCHQAPTSARTPQAPADPVGPIRAPSPRASAATTQIQEREPPARKAPLEPNGNGADDDPGHSALPKHGHWERVGRHWGSLTRICDLQP